MADKRSYDLAGKAALISGAGGPLGRRLAVALAAAGARVILVGRRMAPLEGIARKIGEAGGRAEAHAADLGDEAQVRRLAETLRASHGRIDVLVNGAATAAGKPIEELDAATWRACLDSSLTSAFLATKIIGESMKERGGSIVNVGSIYGVVSADPRIYPPGMAGSSADYAAAKAGLLGLTRHVAVHWARHGIRCNMVAPGGVESERNADPAFREAYSARAPLGRMARADEVEGAVLFLASEASSYVTGQCLAVDGGWTAW